MGITGLSNLTGFVEACKVDHNIKHYSVELFYLFQLEEVFVETDEELVRVCIFVVLSSKFCHLCCLESNLFKNMLNMRF